MTRMTRCIDPAIAFVVAALLLIEVVLLFSLKRHYEKKLQEQQRRFATYLQKLDEENTRLKKKRKPS